MIYKTQRFALLTFDYNIRVPFRLATKKIPKLHITSPLWGSSRDGRWIAIAPPVIFHLKNHVRIPHKTLQWSHNGRDGVSNHQPHDCLLKRLFRRRSKKTSKLCVTGPCAGNSPVAGEFPAQMASNAEKVSIWWRHHEILVYVLAGCKAGAESSFCKTFPCHGVTMKIIICDVSATWT